MRDSGTAGRRATGLPPPPAPRWELGPAPDPERVELLEQSLRLPRPLCSILAARGHVDPESAKAFLRPSLSTLHPAEAMPDLPRAVERILTALRKSETILIHGDYDVDGMAATALMVRWLRRMGGRVVPFVPHRLRDGYDLGPSGLRAAVEAGASLLLTVDCGILAFETVDQAHERGIDVIISDHHMPAATLPPALAVLDPHRKDRPYPGPGPCGAGVAFKLCQGLAEATGTPQEELHPFLDLVGLATVADLVPLTGENRTLARFGLRALSRTRNPGLRALMARAGVDPGDLTASTLGFVLAPRLNALGRLGEPSVGLRLLLTDSPEEADTLAGEAEELNRARQDADRRTLDEAVGLLEAGFDPDRDFGVVLASPSWHPGVVGIVASRVVEQIYRPVVLVALDGDRGRGSARSIPEYHLLEGVRACAPHLERFGGHRQAAGMEVRRDRLEAFRDAFNEHARRVLDGMDLRPALSLEGEVRLQDLSWDLHKYLQYLGPHGIGNPRPTFVARGLTLQGTPRIVGSDHLKVRLGQGNHRLEGIGFHLGRRIAPGALGDDPLDVAFHLHENIYRGVRTLQARLKDIRPGNGPATAGPAEARTPPPLPPE